MLGLWQREVTDNHYHEEDYEDTHDADDNDPPHVNDPLNDRLNFVRGQEVQESVEGPIGIHWTAPRQEVTISNHVSSNADLTDRKHTIVPKFLSDGWIFTSQISG